MGAATKICGLSTPEAVRAALDGGAAFLGFMFFERSPRNVAPDAAARLAEPARGKARIVAVLVDPTDETLADLSATGALTALQLHGKENPERVAAIRQRFGIPVWKAIPVKTRADIDAAGAYAGAADFILFDAKTPEGAALPGGMGLRFDWTLLQGHVHPAPWALSGGLNIANVADAARITGAALVDVSSGVESAPGVKDVDKIAAFLKAVGQL